MKEKEKKELSNWADSSAIWVEKDGQKCIHHPGCSIWVLTESGHSNTIIDYDIVVNLTSKNEEIEEMLSESILNDCVRDQPSNLQDDHVNSLRIALQRKMFRVETVAEETQAFLSKYVFMLRRKLGNIQSVDGLTQSLLRIAIAHSRVSK